MQPLGEFHHADAIFIPIFVGSVRRQGRGNGKAIDIAIKSGQAGGLGDGRARARWSAGGRRELVRVREKKAGDRGGT